jgi:hypothetical protein
MATAWHDASEKYGEPGDYSMVLRELLVSSRQAKKLMNAYEALSATKG